MHGRWFKFLCCYLACLSLRRAFPSGAGHYCGVDPDCLGVRCCAKLELLNWRKYINAAVLYDKCSRTIELSFQSWKKNVSASKGRLAGLLTYICTRGYFSIVFLWQTSKQSVLTFNLAVEMFITSRSENRQSFNSVSLGYQKDVSFSVFGIGDNVTLSVNVAVNLLSVSVSFGVTACAGEVCSPRISIFNKAAFLFREAECRQKRGERSLIYFLFRTCA